MAEVGELLLDIGVCAEKGFVNQELLTRIEKLLARMSQENRILKKDIMRLYFERSVAEESVHVLESQKRIYLIVVGILTLLIFGYFCL